ncbi:RIP metalloprotease RseP [Acidovorax sp. HDW3]|uniref:RIP metalloprotease RseP n=1 Tax=Acidovorax sp. HDW3 TaxID=2714923 RepID=UPI00140A5A15|nr:RIP metalloprotease RseP [Acidovorax sp. HDW3]QIL43528.1 RIP metalloprotease RseP [Acidovorax sp. HDW3]
MLLTLVAFLAALALLIAVHEYGHYRVAVACGVKVLRFSVGFGQPLLRWTKKGQPTEFVIGLFPLGGYVRMLDEREAPVDASERHLAFNTQPLHKRAAIVAAGPLANLLLAVLLYTLVNWSGVEEPRAIVASPVAGSVAEQAGLRGGELVHAVAVGADEVQSVRSFEDLRWTLARATLDGENVRLDTSAPDGGAHRQLVLETARIDASEADAQLFRKIGIVGPWTAPVLGEIIPDAAAARAGLREGDQVLKVGNTEIVDGAQLRELIRAAVHNGQGQTQTWQLRRAGTLLSLDVTPEVRTEAQGAVGRIGAFVGAPPQMLTVRYGAWDGFWSGVQRTWEVSSLTLRTMGRMVIGEASLKNLSGPLTIADYAGRSASMGLTQYLAFLALISVSLGVLNLLPLPVLDGGHLLYYLWEAVTGKGVSEVWMERLQRAGVVLLVLMMSIALFNDVTRLFG